MGFIKYFLWVFGAYPDGEVPFLITRSHCYGFGTHFAGNLIGLCRKRGFHISENTVSQQCLIY